MPSFDRTGPRGRGPRTGRGLGICSTGKRPRRSYNLGRRSNRGFGRRRFRR